MEKEIKVTDQFKLDKEQKEIAKIKEKMEAGEYRVFTSVDELVKHLVKKD